MRSIHASAEEAAAAAGAAAPTVAARANGLEGAALAARLRQIESHFLYAAYCNVSRCGCRWHALSFPCLLLVFPSLRVLLLRFMLPAPSHARSRLNGLLLHCLTRRSLFEKDKLLLSFLLASRLAAHRGNLPHEQLRFLVNGGGGAAPAGSAAGAPPAPLGIPVRAWSELLVLSALPVRARMGQRRHRQTIGR